MFDISGFEAGSAAVALTGAVLGWVLRPLFLRDRPTFVAAIAVIAALAALYGLSSEASAVNDARPVPHASPLPASPTHPVAPVVAATETAALCEQAREIARANGGSLAGEPAQLVARALALDPSDPVALAMAASAAFDERDYDDAMRKWESLEAVLPPHSPQQREVEEGMARARLMADAAR